jgi:thiol-disulfide isomerase/thioredoxin
MFAEFDKIAPGKPSVEWSFPDINGKNISSTDFIGKYVYIDVWASWCGPCKVEIPYLETLKKKLAGKNIAFVSISVDENIEDWKNSLKKESATGIQLYANGWENALCKHFKINGIPRFILLDRDGNIIKSDADRPSGEIETVINDLEGI